MAGNNSNNNIGCFSGYQHLRKPQVPNPEAILQLKKVIDIKQEIPEKSSVDNGDSAMNDTTRRDSTSSDKKLIASQYFQLYSINFKDVITYLFIFLISLFIYLFMYVLLIKAYILDKYLHFIVIPVTKHNINNSNNFWCPFNCHPNIPPRK